MIKNDEVIFTGEIPARCIGEYRNDLNLYTNGRSVCLTELKGYQEISGEPVLQPRRPNSRLDKVRHMFQKITYYIVRYHGIKSMNIRRVYVSFVFKSVLCKLILSKRPFFITRLILYANVEHIFLNCDILIRKEGLCVKEIE